MSSTQPMPEMATAGAYAGRSHTQYRKAQIHSRRVRALKILLPLASVLVIIAFVAVSFVETLVPDGVEIESVAVRDGKLVMQNPVMSGQTTDARPYRMEALRAIQDLSAPDVITLEEIVADLPVSDQGTAVLNASSAIYDRSAQTLVFTEPFTVDSETGFAAQMRSADVDIATGEMTSSDPVSIQTGDASVVAQSMKMQDNGRVIILQDKVRMTINPSAIKPKDGETN
ncbi:LPS export ABC transporter periplasmic protein LptC [uncultured Hoeflea sp.]|uniref:LPS export ABC transporter periplasmic protein LptC n=1 Tax=uncultured Hoeflea sp. TaxID=538666 RepID=UPI002624FC3F|nr:LPS export ABC transporter periplasmic protein LptC [uncultured Hoeflea sp.]